MAYRRWPSRQREARPLSITDVVEEPFATGKDCLSIALGVPASVFTRLLVTASLRWRLKLTLAA
ncbi:MAG: hypothetical protein ACUVQR_13555, partial [Thermogutta sp.]